MLRPFDKNIDDVSDVTSQETLKNTKPDFEYKGKYFKGGQKKYTELKKLAKIPEKIRINEDIINNLWVSGLVSPMYNGLVKLNFMDEIYEIEKDIKDEDKIVVILIFLFIYT